jgi:hypothetical protein
MHVEFCLDELKERDHSDGLGKSGRTILKRMFKKLRGREPWLMTGTTCELL